MLFSLRKHHLDLFVADTALKVSQSLYCFTTSISHGVENNFPRLWGTGISDAIFYILELTTEYLHIGQKQGNLTFFFLFFSNSLCGN